MPVNTQVFGKIRVQAFTENIIRIEYDKRGEFCDENTFFIPDKSGFKGCPFTAEETGNGTPIKITKGSIYKNKPIFRKCI